MATTPLQSVGENIRHLWRNSLTVAGGLISGVTTLFLLSFLFFDLLAPNPNPYLGVFTYLIFPIILVIGLLMITIGLWVARRKHLREGIKATAYYLPRIDFNDPRQRRVLSLGAATTLGSLPIIGLLSYRGYHYTDSNEFCGKVCHEVMEPQYTAYQHSPHAHVDCAECHIGEGATWYVKAKLSGLRQVWAVARGSFPRPIPPAIHELRPATETCGQCHWPSRFYGDQLVTQNHYASDEANTRGQLRMLLKTGGSDPRMGPPSGIHWHMAEGFSVEYVATDHDLQVIPWVQMVNHNTGEKRVFRSDGKAHTEAPPEGTHRTIDCMDCHNRPTHIFHPPDRAVNKALDVHPALQTMPFAKREMVSALTKDYATKDEALKSIDTSLREFYQKNHAGIATDRAKDVDQLVAMGQSVYSSNIFPAMNASWESYPNNIGHMFYPGCFRCHEGKHVDDKGVAITHECSACHEFIVPAAGGAKGVEVGGFTHPVPLEGVHATLRCNECHTGGSAPVNSCDGCHAATTAFRNGNLIGFEKFKRDAEPMAEIVTCDGCHDVSKKLTLAAIDGLCMECHEDEEAKYKGMLTTWKSDVEELLRQAETRTDAHGREVLEALRKAGPLHNVEATKSILRELMGTTASAAGAKSEVK